MFEPAVIPSLIPGTPGLKGIAGTPGNKGEFSFWSQLEIVTKIKVDDNQLISM